METEIMLQELTCIIKRNTNPEYLRYIFNYAIYLEKLLSGIRQQPTDSCKDLSKGFDLGRIHNANIK